MRNEERKRKGGQLQRSVLTTLLMYELYWDYVNLAK